MDANFISFLSLGGAGCVTKNMYVYEFGKEIFIVDCGLGFADDTMLGVDLLLPDITYLIKAVQNGKTIVGMALTHGHEDHMGALPFVLPQLPAFPIYATPFSAALANAKLRDFGMKPFVKEVQFNQQIDVGTFSFLPIHVTHSVPDTAHIFIKTPLGNFYHGSDFKFDLSPFDGKKTDFQAIVKAGSSGIRCLISECLGADRPGYTPSETTLTQHFVNELQQAKGKVLVTTYSSNISRLNQVIAAGLSCGKQIGFVGRSLIKAKDLAREKGLFTLKKTQEIDIENLKRYHDKDMLLFVAGSQGQENSALSRIIDGEHRYVKIKPEDVVIFSADPIPGNEVSVNSLIDSLSRLGVRVVKSSNHEFHVSGHGSQQELTLLMQLLNPKQVLPISGNFRHMALYKTLAVQQGYTEQDVIIPENGQQVLFGRDKTTLGQKIPLRHVYVDEVSGEEVEQFVLRDRQKISTDGIVAIIAEVDGEDGSLVGKPEVVSRGLPAKEGTDIERIVTGSLQNIFVRHNRISDWNYLRKQIREIAERKIYEELKRNPLILPVVIEV